MRRLLNVQTSLSLFIFTCLVHIHPSMFNNSLFMSSRSHGSASCHRTKAGCFLHIPQYIFFHYFIKVCVCSFSLRDSTKTLHKGQVAKKDGKGHCLLIPVRTSFSLLTVDWLFIADFLNFWVHNQTRLYTRSRQYRSCAGGRGVVVGPIVSQSLSDVFCDNEYGPNFLFRNNGDGTFTDVAPQAGSEGHFEISCSCRLAVWDTN